MKITFIFSLFFISLSCILFGSLHAMQGGAILKSLSKKYNNPELTEKLLAAVERGDLKQAQALVRSGASINARDRSGRTPLHWAVDQGREELANFLLHNKANINAQDNAGETPLHYAAFEGYLPIVRLLLSKGADAKIRNSTDRTALDYARDQNHQEVANLIKNYVRSRRSTQLQASPEAEFGINLE